MRLCAHSGWSFFGNNEGELHTVPIRVTGLLQVHGMRAAQRASLHVSFSEAAHPFPHIKYYILTFSNVKWARNCKKFLNMEGVSAPRSEHTYNPSLVLSWMISRAQQRKTLHVQVSYNSAKALYGDQKSVDPYCPRELLKMQCHRSNFASIFG